MRKLILVAGAGLAACAWAGSEPRVILTLGTATGSTGTVANVSYLDEIQVSVSDGVSTGTVAVAVLTADNSVSATSIATNAVTGSKTWRPVVDATDIAGTALSSDPPRRWLLVLDTLRLIVTDSPTNVTWTLRAKLSDS
jgi:hypothetical protein